LNWKMVIASHWKVALVLSLLTIRMICGTAFAEPIDCPGVG